MYHALAFYDGFCADCHVDMPLVLIERGPRGVRAWLAGIGSEDRALTYTCRVCGRNEHVPLTEAEDAVYDATLATWPDTVFALPTYAGADVEYDDAEYDDYPEYALPAAAWQPEAGDVFVQAALHLASAPVQAPAALVEPAAVFAPAAAPAAILAPASIVEPAAVFASAAAPAAILEPLVAFAPERRRPLVRRVEALPRQRVSATDGLPLALAVA